MSLLLISFVVISACGKKENGETIKLGVVGEKNEPWEYVQKELEKENINLELVKFTDYREPIVALEGGDIDLHAALTEIYMENINKESGFSNTTIAYTSLNPLGIYSKKIKNIKDLKDKADVAIPNDVSNESRALLLLQTAGLIKLDKSKGLLPSVSDIKENSKNLQIKTLESSQTARALDDVDISLINNDKAVDAGMFPTEDAIFLEPVADTSKPYYNVIAARKKDKDKEVYKKVVEAFQTDEVKKIIKDTTKGSSIPVWDK